MAAHPMLPVSYVVAAKRQELDDTWTLDLEPGGEARIDEFEPGQFYRLQNFETSAPVVEGVRLMMEGLALTGAWVDEEKGLLSMIVLEMGTSSRLCSLLKEGEEVLKKKAEIPAEVLDAALIESAQKVEHYEIAAYGSAATYANSLQERRVANLMKETLDEEKETDKKLTKLAEDGINRQAKSG